MRFPPSCGLLLLLALPAAAQPGDPAAATVNRFYAEALTHGTAHARLRELTTRYPGRLSGSPALAGAIDWAKLQLAGLGLDRVYTQEVMVPHWERGAPETVTLLAADGPVPLAAAALGNSGATPPGGLTAEVIEVHSVAEVAQLGTAQVAGRIVFYNRPMDPTLARTEDAYSTAADQRTQGPSAAARLGAVAVLVRSLTLAHDDFPHAGNSTYVPDYPRIPAVALGILSAERLAAALAAHPHTRVSLQVSARTLPPAPSQNVIGEIRGREFPDQVILVGGHLDSWDITPGAHDDGAGVVQSMEVLRLFRALGLHPRHTLRCVLFTNEENGLAGGTRYAELARAASVRHVFAVETDNGGFAPTVYPGNYDYFRYRQDQIQAADAAHQKNNPPAQAAPAPSTDWEAKKRLEAEGRKKVRRVETLHKEIAYSRKTVETLAAKM